MFWYSRDEIKDAADGGPEGVDGSRGLAHQALGIEVKLSLEPGFAPGQDVGPLLLGRVDRKSVV